MVKEDEELDLSTDNIQKILTKLVSEGRIFASCPKCSQYLSYNERELLYCNGCKHKLKVEEILYSANKGSGQNN